MIEILLIEDSAADARLTAEALKEGDDEFHLSVINDGESALRFLRQSGTFAQAPRPHLVILDLGLPRKSGLELLAEIKSDPKLAAIPVVVFTTSQSGVDAQRAFELHANCFVPKPPELGDFFARVRLMKQFWLRTVALPPGDGSV